VVPPAALKGELLLPKALLTGGIEFIAD